jgi:dipeptidyl aminopeptidase/acylaminoacyl peptidase
VEDLELSDDGTRLAFRTNEDGIGKLYVLDTRTRAYQPVPGIPAGVLGGLAFHPDNVQLAFSVSSAQSPGDVYVLNTQSNTPERWTHSEVGGLNPASFIAPTLIRYDTFDKVNGKPRQIPAFYYKPKGNGKFPVVISIHGGPEGQFTPGFSWLPQYLTGQMGIALIAPNVRGSTGYGKTYVTLDNGTRREESVQDIGKLLDWIAKQPELDASRVLVYGGSYGGYMTLASLTHFNDRLRGGIDVVGISNWITFLEKTESYRRDLRRAEYGDERDAKMREVPDKNIAGQQRAEDYQAAVRDPGPQRPAGAGRRIGADGAGRAQERGHGVVPGRQGRRARLPQKEQFRLPNRRHDAIHGTVSKGRE